MPSPAYYVKVDKGLPVNPIALDLKIQGYRAIWFNLERYHSIEFSSKKEEAHKIQLICNNKTVSFQEIDLDLYNDKLKGRVKKDFTSDDQVQQYFLSKL